MRRFLKPASALLILAGSVALAALLISLAPEPEEQLLPPQVPFALTAKVEDGGGGVPIHAGGTVRAAAEVELAPQVGGKVIWVDPAFQSGARVQQGQVLFRIEEDDYAHAVEIAKASLAAREVELLETEENAKIAASQYQRYAGDKDKAAMEAGPLALWEPQLKAARADRERDQARLAQAHLDLARTAVTAPFDGHVREESVDAGDILASGERVARLIAADAVEVVVSLASSDAALIPGLWELRPGASQAKSDSATIVASYGAGRYAWSGHVDRAEAALDRQTRTIDVVVLVREPFAGGTLIDGDPALGGSPPLLVGEYVQVEIEGAASVPFLRIPRAALNPGNEVWLVNDAGTIEIQTVRVLQRTQDKAFVAGRLAHGQRVVIGGLQFATNGMRVQFSD